ncbi:MAG: hypothetical protein K2P95_05865 [Hyphomonadaceae bacterium]|nr:hypothetical protein [Hyphomonadaceae bacterium]
MQRSERNTPPEEKQAASEGLDQLLQRQKHLTAQLRAAFTHVTEEPVPDEFLALIDQLATRNEDESSSNPNEVAND